MTKVKKQVDMKRININAPASLVDRVKEYADNLGVNTTSAYIFLLNQALDQKDTLSNLPLVLQLFNQLKSINSDDANESIGNLLSLDSDDTDTD